MGIASGNVNAITGCHASPAAIQAGGAAMQHALVVNKRALPESRRGSAFQVWMDLQQQRVGKASALAKRINIPSPRSLSQFLRQSTHLIE